MTIISNQPRRTRGRGPTGARRRSPSLMGPMLEVLGFLILVTVIWWGMRHGFAAGWRPLGLAGIATGVLLVLVGQRGTGR